MKRIFVVLVVFCAALLSSPLHAADIYFTQAGGGSGASCGNARAVSSHAAGDDVAGNVEHLCGTITATIQIGASGSAGNPVTFLWESGAIVQQAAGDMFELNGHSHLVFDGGSACGPGTTCAATDTGTGIIQNTANGSSLANQLADVRAFGSSDGSGDIEIKNLIIRNIYVHNLASDRTNSIDTATNVISSSSGGASGFTGNITAHDNTIHDVGLPFQLEKFTGSPTIEMYRNYIWNVNWSVEDSGNGLRTISYHDNHDGGRSNWDNSFDDYHHNGLHLFQNVSSDSVSTSVYNNTFDGDWGTCCTTAFIFEEVNPPSNFNIFNNLFLQHAGNRFPLVDISSTSGAGAKILNNTFYGGGNGDPMAAGNCLKQDGASITIENNAFLNCNQLITLKPGTSISAIDYNQYGQQSAGGNNIFNWQNTTQTNTFSTWQSACACDGHGSNPGGLLGLNTSGVPSGGSSLFGAGINLSNLLSNPGLVALRADINGVQRQGGNVAWNLGAVEPSGGPVGPWTVQIQSSNPSNGVAVTCTADSNGKTSGTTTTAFVYANGANVTCGAAATVASWSGGCTPSGNNCSNASVSASATYVANYAVTPPVTLSVHSTNPASGVSIPCTGGTASSPFTQSYSVGSTVTCTAPSTVGLNAFSSWTCTGGTVSGNVCTFSAIATDVTITANYGGGVGPICQASGSSFSNLPIVSQSGTFALNFSSTPSQSNMDGVFGLSMGAAAAYSDLAVIPRFNVGGTIDAWNQAVTNYAAVNSFPYNGGVIYHFRLAVNASAGTYDLYVTAPGGAEVQIASGYTFRTGAEPLNNWANTSEVGSRTDCGVSVQNPVTHARRAPVIIGIN